MISNRKSTKDNLYRDDLLEIDSFNYFTLRFSN